MSVLTRARAVSVLNLREKRASNRPSVLKPFFRRLFRASQPSGPHQSRKSQAFVKPKPPFSPFSSIVTPYSHAPVGQQAVDIRKQAHDHEKRKRRQDKAAFFRMAQQCGIQIAMRQHIIEQRAGQKFHEGSLAEGCAGPAEGAP